MTTYVPKLHRPVIAVQLKEDLLIPKGDWLTLDADNYEEINQFTDTQFRSVYGVTQPVAKKPAKQKVAKQLVISGIPSKRLDNDPRRTLQGVLSSKPGRFFYYIRRIGRPATFRDIVNSATIESDKGLSGASGAISLLKTAGLVDVQIADIKSPSGKIIYLYTESKIGCEEFDKLGPICFTRYGFSVPSDSVDIRNNIATQVFD